MPTDIGYTGQRADASTNLMFYGARYYSPYLNRWLSPDTIVPDPKNPQSLNRYSYVNNRPLNFSDPTGHIAEGQEASDALALIKRLQQEYGITVVIDFGWIYTLTGLAWNPGAWRNLDELQAVESVAQRYSDAARGQASGILSGMSIYRIAQGETHQMFNRIDIADYTFDQQGGGALQKLWGPQVAIAHEFAHYWDWKTGDWFSQAINSRGQLSAGLANAIGTEKGPTNWARTGPYGEDWAETTAGYLYPEYFDFLAKEQSANEAGVGLGLGSATNGSIPSFNPFGLPGLGPAHSNYVAAQFRALWVTLGAQ